MSCSCPRTLQAPPERRWRSREVCEVRLEINPHYDPMIGRANNRSIDQRRPRVLAAANVSPPTLPPSINTSCPTTACTAAAARLDILATPIWGLSGFRGEVESACSWRQARWKIWDKTGWEICKIWGYLAVPGPAQCSTSRHLHPRNYGLNYSWRDVGAIFI